MRAQRHTTGSVRYDKRRRTWNYLWYDGPVRRSKRIGTKQEFPTKAAAWAAVQQPTAPLRKENRETMHHVITRYKAERMPSRVTTAKMYRSLIANHIQPKWGSTIVEEVQPRPVELWLRELPLAPKSKTHVRGLMHALLEFAMWAGMLEIGRNPISLVQNKGATRKVRKASSLTAEQFQALLPGLHEPFSTLALVSVCLGLRISEAFGLRWEDVDWLGAQLHIRRGIVAQHVDDVKTDGSAKALSLTPELLERLKAHRQRSSFTGPEDWVFASPHQIGRLPYSYTGVRRILQRAATAANLGRLSTHSFRHTYRSWLDAVGTGVAVQQKMMRHSDIRTTFNVYGDVVTDEMAIAGSKVSQLAFQGNGVQTERSTG